jgi:hypothetical protein
MSLDLKHVDLTRSEQHQRKPHQKPYRRHKSAFLRLTRRNGNGDAAGAMSAGMGRRYALNVLDGFMQLMRKWPYRLLCARSGHNLSKIKIQHSISDSEQVR